MQGDAVAEFYQQLGKFAESRLPLPQGLREIAGATRNGKLRKALDAVAKDTESGLPLSAALEEHAGFASPFHLSLIRAGESSDTLPDLLFAAARHARSRQDILERLRAIVSYPVVTMFTAIGTALVCLTSFLPMIREVIRSTFGSDAELPTILRVTEPLQPLGPILWLVWGILFALAVFFLIGGRFTRKPLYALLSRMPGIRRITHGLDTTRLTGLLSTLVRNRLPLTDALDLGSEIVASPRLQADLAGAAGEIREGKAPAEAMARDSIDPLLPILFGQSPDDALPKELDLLQDFYADRTETTIRRVTTTWNTVMFVFMIVIALGALMLVLVPMVDLVSELEAFQW